MMEATEQLAFGYVRPGAASAVPAVAKRNPAVEEQLAVATADDSLRWAFRGLLLFTALLFFRPQDHLPALRVIPVAELAAMFALSTLVVGRARRRELPSRMTPELLGVLFLGVVIAATIPTSIWPTGSLGVLTDLYAKVALIFLLMLNTLTTPRRLERFTYLIVAATTYLAIRACIDHFQGANLIEDDRVRGAVGGVFRNPNDLALNMVSFLPLSLMLAVRPGFIGRRVAALAAALLMVAAVVFTQSRSGALGLLVMLAVFAWQAIRLRPGLLCALLVLALLSTPALPESFWDRMEGITTAEADDTGSREARVELMKTAWWTFVDHPLTGVGAGQFKNYNPVERVERWRATHNVILQVAAELGIFGVFAMLFLIVRAWRAARWSFLTLIRPVGRRRPIGVRNGRRTKRRNAGSDVDPAAEAEFLRTHAAAVIAGLAGWFVCAMFASVAFNWTFYYLLALAIAPREILRARGRTAGQHFSAAGTAKAVPRRAWAS
jgi:putative inorganic carbon (HCO3(-)) transporter